MITASIIAKAILAVSAAATVFLLVLQLRAWMRHKHRSLSILAWSSLLSLISTVGFALPHFPVGSYLATWGFYTGTFFFLLAIGGGLLGTVELLRHYSALYDAAKAANVLPQDPPPEDTFGKWGPK